MNDLPRMKLRAVDVDPFIVAEIGVNHDGDAARCLDLVHAAAEAGADAVKFQWFQPSELLSRSAFMVSYQADAGESDARSMLQRLGLSIDELAGAVALASSLDLRSMVTVFTPALVQEAARLPWDLFKTASPDLTNRPLLEALRDTGRPLVISTGGHSLQEVEVAVGWLPGCELGIMQCVSSYPTSNADASLSGIRVIAEATGLPVGYSDHTTSVHSGGLAVAAGATILEKHLTLDRSLAGPDHAVSLDPGGFAEYVGFAREARVMLGPQVKTGLDCELEVRSASSQSVAVREEVGRGETLHAGNLTTMRPGGGIPPERLGSLIGRRVVRNIPAGTLLEEDDLQHEVRP